MHNDPSLRQFSIHNGKEARALTHSDEILALTEAATLSTYYRDDLSPIQIAANREIITRSAPSCFRACESGHQHFAAAFVDRSLAGYVIATRHAADNLELDWLMVHPDHHGAGIAAALMREGIVWLGADQTLWLNVIRHNARAIGFYRKFGFEIDADAITDHVVPQWIMRRSGRASRAS